MFMAITFLYLFHTTQMFFKYWFWDRWNVSHVVKFSSKSKDFCLASRKWRKDFARPKGAHSGNKMPARNVVPDIHFGS